MKLKELETGMVVVIDGEKYMTMVVDRHRYFINSKSWMCEDGYNEEMELGYDNTYDITRVYHKCKKGDLRESQWDGLSMRVLWDRKDPIRDEIDALKHRIKELEEKL